MAKSKTNTAGGNGPEGGQGISKVDAVVDALQQLGENASNKDLGDYIRSKYGEQLLPGNFTVTKSAAKKKLRQGGGKRKGRRGGRKAAAPPAPPPSPSTGGGISLEDLRQIKELAGRYGKDQIKGVLDLLA
jgi:hypothetical protein